MRLGNQEITKEQMPSFVDFSSNPKHLYNLMQDQLNMSLQSNIMQMQQQGKQQNEQK